MIKITQWKEQKSLIFFIQYIQFSIQVYRGSSFEFESSIYNFVRKRTPKTLKIIWWILSPFCTHLYCFSLHFFLNNIVMALNVSLENHMNKHYITILLLSKVDKSSFRFLVAQNVCICKPSDSISYPSLP